MTLEPTLVADVLVNLFGAGGAIVVAREVRRSDPNGPVSRRIAFALWFVAVLFVTRAWSWYSNGLVTDAIVTTLASATPLVSLIVAEGLLRRHAPRGLKLALVSAPLVVFGAMLLPFVPVLVQVALLLATVLGGFVAIAVLLWTRDADSLTIAENSTIRRVLIAVLFLAPLIVTDFRFIWSDIPVRLGALGALVLMHVGLGVGTFHSSLQGRMSIVAVYAVVAALFAFGYVSTGHSAGGFEQLMRAAATGVAGLLFAGLFAESQGARSERTRASVQLVGASSPEDFMHRLSSHPLLSDAQLLPDEALEQVAHPDFQALLEHHPTLRRSAAPWGCEPTDDGVERALSLMRAHDATDLAMITAKPLRLIAVSLPAMAEDARIESEIDVAQIVGALVYSKATTT